MSTARTAVYSGVPARTLGHGRGAPAAGLFDRLIIADGRAHHKKTLFSLDERVAQVQPLPLADQRDAGV
jgi:pantetheine-phosphate adenylyltransferase